MKRAGVVRLANRLRSGGTTVPRKNKQFKSKLRDAADASQRGDKKQANKLWQEVTLARARLRAEREERRADKRAERKS